MHNCVKITDFVAMIRDRKIVLDCEMLSGKELPVCDETEWSIDLETD